MKKTLNSTFIMLAVLAGLSAWYFLYEQKYKPEQKDKEEQGMRLVSYEQDQILEIELQRLTNPGPLTAETTTVPKIEAPIYEKILLKKNGKEWFVTEPLQDRADDATVNSVLSTLTSAKQERVVEEKPKDLSSFGLSAPSNRITVKKDSTSKGIEVMIGSNTPVGYSAYAKTSLGASVFKVNRSLKSGIEKDLLALRNKSILNFSRADVTEVEITNSKENLVLKLDDKESWSLSRENLPADLNEWNKTFNPLLEIKATAFASEKADNLAAFGLNKTFAKVIFTKKDKNRVVLLVGTSKDKAYAKREDRETIFEIDKALLDKIATGSNEYRSKQLASFNRYDITRIKLQRGGEITELTRGADSIWSFPSDAAAKVDSAQVDSLLTKLQDAKLVKYLPAKSSQTELTNPALTLSLYESKAGTTEKESVLLHFAKIKDPEVLVQRAGLSQSFLIKREDFEMVNLFKQSFIKSEEKAKEPEKKS